VHLVGFYYKKGFFYVFPIVHCIIIIGYKPTKCTFSELIFQSVMLLHVSNPRVHLQEDGRMYSYSMVWYVLHASV